MQPSDDWISLLDMCLSLPMSAPQCRPVWEVVMYVSVGVALVISGWLIWKWLNGRNPDQPVRTTAGRPAVERKSIPEQSTAKQKYDERDPSRLIEDVTDPHLKEKIRRELEQRKLKNMQGR